MRKILGFISLLFCFVFTYAQTPQEVGSKTAKDGFKNEDNVRDKFNAWQTDDDAKKWLEIMGYNLTQISNVFADKPHGYNANAKVKVTLKAKTETIGEQTGRRRFEKSRFANV